MKLKISSRRWKKIAYFHSLLFLLPFACDNCKQEQGRNGRKGEGTGRIWEGCDIFQVRYMFIVSRSIEYRPTKTYCNRNISVGSVMQKVKRTTCGMICIFYVCSDRNVIVHSFIMCSAQSWTDSSIYRDITTLCVCFQSGWHRKCSIVYGCRESVDNEINLQIVNKISDSSAVSVLTVHQTAHKSYIPS